MIWRSILTYIYSSLASNIYIYHLCVSTVYHRFTASETTLPYLTISVAIRRHKVTPPELIGNSVIAFIRSSDARPESYVHEGGHCGDCGTAHCRLGPAQYAPPYHPATGGVRGVHLSLSNVASSVRPVLLQPIKYAYRMHSGPVFEFALHSGWLLEFEWGMCCGRERTTQPDRYLHLKTTL